MSDLDPEVVQIFRDEANERLDRMADTLLALEEGRVGAGAVDELFRDAHTIKGGAAMLGFDRVRDLAHAVEDVLADVREAGAFPPELAEPLLRSADALRAQIAGNGDSAPQILEELARLRKEVGSPANGTTDAEQQLPAGDGAAGGRSIRVPAAKLDALLDLVGETMLHRRRLEHALGGAVENQSVTDELGLGDHLLDKLKDRAIRLRTLPLASITGPFPRAVHDMAAAEGKDVELELRGTETELDRVILAGLSEPLTHLLRNAVAHGIESPEARERAGKPRRGTVWLEAGQRGGFVAVTVRDDGRGISADVLRLAAGAPLADVLSRSGYSTAGGVTTLAGRGVGLDAVRTQIQSFGGELEVRSDPGRGLQVELLLPLTLALLRVLLVERGRRVYALPLVGVEEVVPVGPRLSLGGRAAIEIRGSSVRLGDLATLLGAEAPPVSARAPAAVVSWAGRRVAAICDRLMGEEEVVIKPLGAILEGLPTYLGAAILGDGRIALILDPAALVRGAQSVEAGPAPSAEPGPKVLVVEDSTTVRELQRSILEAAGYRVATARDGRDGLSRVTSDPEIDLVVTDVEMPEMDGIALTKAIRSRPQTASLPVVIMTMHATEDDRRRGIESGADAYMTKGGFDQHALLETVERLVGR